MTQARNLSLFADNVSSSGTVAVAGINATGTPSSTTYLRGDGTWATVSGGVTSFSAGTTGFTPSTATTGAVTLAGTLITSNGGTGLSSYTAGDLSYYASGTALSKLAIGTSGYLLTSSGTAPQWSNSISIGAGTFTSLTDSGLTSGRVTYAGTGGLLTDSANFTYDGFTLTNNTGSTGGTTGFSASNSIANGYTALTLKNTGASGKTFEVGVGGNGTAGNYQNNLYIRDTSGNPTFYVNSTGIGAIGKIEVVQSSTFPTVGFTYNSNGYLYTLGGSAGTITQIGAVNRFAVNSSGLFGFGSTGASSDRLADMSFSGATTAGATQFGIVLNPTYPNTPTTSIYNLYAGPNLTSGTTVTNVYGLYLEAGNYTGCTVTNKYALYQAGTADNNLFSGKTTFNAQVTLAFGNAFVPSTTNTALYFIGAAYSNTNYAGQYYSGGTGHDVFMGMLPNSVSGSSDSWGLGIISGGAYSNKMMMDSNGNIKVLSNIIDTNNEPWTFRLFDAYANSIWSYGQKVYNQFIGTSGDPSYAYVLLCEAYQNGATQNKTAYTGYVYWQRGSTGAGNFSFGCLVMVSAGYNNNSYGGKAIGNINIDICQVTYSSVKYLAVRIGYTSSADVYASGFSSSAIAPTLVSDGSVSAVTVLTTLAA